MDCGRHREQETKDLGHAHPGWEKVRFGDVVRNVLTTVKDPAAAGYTRYVGLDHIIPGSFNVQRWGLVADGTSFTKCFKPNHVLFGKRRAYQRKIAVPDFPGVCSGDILVFECRSDRLIPELLPFLVQSDGFYEYALKTSSGSLSPRTKFQHLKNYEFLLPSMEDQRRIAELLISASSVISRYEQIRESLLLAGHSAISSVFETNVAFENGKYHSNSWKLVPLQDVIVGSTKNGLYKSRSQYDGEVEMVHMGDIFGALEIVNGGMQRVRSDASEVRQFGLAAGDLLFARRSIVLEGAGQSCLVGKLSEPLLFESSIIRVRPRREVVDPEFLAIWFSSRIGRRSVRRIVRWSTIAGIAGSDLIKILVPVPTQSEQRAIVACAQSFQLAVNEIQKNIAAAQEMAAQLREATLRGQLNERVHRS